MFRPRWLILPGILAGLFVFMIYNGLIAWKKDSYACYHGRHFYNAVDKQRWLKVGSLQLYYQPKTWGCSDEERYDPTKYEINAGVMVPKGSSELTQ